MSVVLQECKRWMCCDNHHLHVDPCFSCEAKHDKVGVVNACWVGGGRVVP